MYLGYIAIGISFVAMLLNIIVVGAQSKTIKYQKASIESLERIIEKQKVLIEIYKDGNDFFERELATEEAEKET